MLEGHSVTWNSTHNGFAYNNNQTEKCYKDLLKIMQNINNRLWREYKYSQSYVSGAEMYTLTILGLFAAIIALLMYRSIKPNESEEDQVMMLLSSMQMRVDYENNLRHKKKMKEGKQKAQEWLYEIKTRGFNRAINRTRAVSTGGSLRVLPSVTSVCSVPLATSGNVLPLQQNPLCRTRSCTVFLPRIVVTTPIAPHVQSQHAASVDGSRAASRQSSVFSFHSQTESIELDTDADQEKLYLA